MIFQCWKLGDGIEVTLIPGHSLPTLESVRERGLWESVCVKEASGVACFSLSHSRLQRGTCVPWSLVMFGEEKAETDALECNGVPEGRAVQRGAMEEVFLVVKSYD